MAYHGHDSYVTFGKETSFGEKASAPTNWIGIVQSFSPEEENNMQTQYGLGSRNFLQSKIGSKNYSGSIEYLVQDIGMLEFALGGKVENTDGTIDYVEKNDLPSLTFSSGFLGSTNFIRDYVGCKVDTLTITAEKEEALTAELEFMAKDMIEGTNGTAPVADTSSYFSFYEGKVKINGVEQALVEEFELEISNGLEGLFAINGEMTVARIQEGNREYSLSVSFVFEDTAQFELFKKGTEFDVELSFAAPDGRELKINVKDCRYDTNEIELGNEDYAVQSLEAVVRSVSANFKTA
ncbi:phage tail tube protein [Priestia endophytica]|uniref:phage tail tube protein n=1 Tax=Priestia endophytica TaxID=135735 RepID=UPI003D2A7B9A